MDVSQAPKEGMHGDVPWPSSSSYRYTKVSICTPLEKCIGRIRTLTSPRERLSRSRSCLSSSSICSETRFASASASRRALRSSGDSEAWLARMTWTSSIQRLMLMEIEAHLRNGVDGRVDAVYRRSPHGVLLHEGRSRSKDVKPKGFTRPGGTCGERWWWKVGVVVSKWAWGPDPRGCDCHGVMHCLNAILNLDQQSLLLIWSCMSSSPTPVLIPF